MCFPEEEQKRYLDELCEDPMKYYPVLFEEMLNEQIEYIDNTDKHFIKELKPTDVGFYVATPYPGTPLYEVVKKNGWLRVLDFDKYDTATPIFETPYHSMKKLMEIRYKAHQRFYLRPTHIIRMFGKGRIYGISALKTSLSYLLRALHIRIS